MPGHKRNPRFMPPALPELDVTEIPTMDVLHEPQGILRHWHDSLAAFFGADESFFLVNGSSAGIVAAICATRTDGEPLYAARNGHAALYNGMALSGAVPVYFSPEMRPDGLAEGVPPARFDEMPAGGVAFLVSPTYEGFVSDITEISRRVHSRGGILIVDEAHGAHFPFHGAFPPPALSQGADVVVNSLHKTLPVLGQCALLHVKGPRVDRERLRFALNAVQTTSPSYMLMAQASYALQMLWDNPGLFADYVAQLMAFRGEMRAARGALRLLPSDDPGKLLFYAEGVPGIAEEIGEVLAREYKIQVEMARGRHILAMTSVADTAEGFARLGLAVRGLKDRVIPARPPEATPFANLGTALPLPEVVLSPREAMQRPTEILPLEDAAGRICAELIAPCPPGIALIAPGERVPGGLKIPKTYIRVTA
ncbi:MAG: hypothetical protein FWB88_12045 [Defluviitaleaceae bacterium]|nr:hypothetical protein [Defluviitaleaceae bacterium]